MRARTGKIARLPKDLRDAVNLALRDGATAAAVRAIVEQAKAHGAKNGDGSEIEPPDDQNVTNWRQGGYQDWLDEQQRLEDMRFKNELALEIVKRNEGSKISEATLLLASSQLYEVLTEFDLGGLKDKLAESPEGYTDVVNALAKLSKGVVDIERFKEQVRREADKILALTSQASKSGGLTPEDLAEIERAAKMMR